MASETEPLQVSGIGVSMDRNPHLASEIEVIQSDLSSMKQELHALELLSKPLLHDSLRRPSHRILELSLPRKSSQVTVSRKWSWADPMDAGAGPGSYNITTEIGRTASLSSFTNRPKAFISKTRKLSSEIEGGKGSQSPPLTRYTPNLTLVQRQFPVVSFSQAAAKRLSYLEEMRKRSPGPIYLQTRKGVTGGKISTSKRDTSAHFIRNEYPSAQHYTYDIPANSRSARFGKSAKDMGVTQYVPGIERFMRGREGELLTTLPDPMNKTTGGNTLKNTGHVQHYDSSAGNPGAGTYPTTWIDSKKGKFTFSKAARHIDIKKSKFQAVGISHEILRI